MRDCNATSVQHDSRLTELNARETAAPAHSQCCLPHLCCCLREALSNWDLQPLWACWGTE